MKNSMLRPVAAIPLPLAVGGLILIALALLPGADTERSAETEAAASTVTLPVQP